MKSKWLFLFLLLSSHFCAFAETSLEADTQKYFESIKNDPKQLNAFLYYMPKGGELHDHLGGASLAENMLRYAKGDHQCLDPQTLRTKIDLNCANENLLDTATPHSKLYDEIISAWSMRNFNSKMESAHDHCFAAFYKFEAIIPSHTGEILAEMAERAARQNEIYLEVMLTPDNNDSGIVGSKHAWHSDLSVLRKQLLQHDLPKLVAKMSNKITADENVAQRELACHTPKAKLGCQVKVKYLYQVFREQPPAQVFAQLLAGFELAKQDARVVGINMVQAENGEIALKDYNLHMKMVGFLHKLYPTVHISLHAGESGPAIAPKEALTFHIRQAIKIGQAERIGHGLDISYEDNADALLKEMAQKHILVETTPSTELILGFEQKDLPFARYLQNGVPIALSTDDEGLFRTNLTEQFQNIVQTYHISYATLKTLARNSITYSFVPGESLWRDYRYEHVVSPCVNDPLGSKIISGTCQQFLKANEKAELQWELEHRFVTFEKHYIG